MVLRFSFGGAAGKFNVAASFSHCNEQGAKVLGAHINAYHQPFRPVLSDPTLCPYRVEVECYYPLLMSAASAAWQA